MKKTNTNTSAARDAGQLYHPKYRGTFRNYAAKMLPLVPTDADDESPETLCANWRRGCNGITAGASPDGRLTHCDDCCA